MEIQSPVCIPEGFMGCAPTHIFNKLHEPKSLCFDYIYVYIRKEGIHSVKKKKKTMELRTQNSDLRTVVLLYQQG